ncbi:MAG: hypothetical protein A2498_02655 [Lentisphaerae bacterium RIFOXYC12_FULL_60_16]|nr:MAG: hypothetical protein A2498_02655 [Lentisphaerae bacterium RIFOXYC12_FULL_60_16]OGV77680.1 MAG: hypothetical protein A2340_11940 [Lentisphaerae bacterium RIFOXYB12_FULL_60_10]
MRIVISSILLGVLVSARVSGASGVFMLQGTRSVPDDAERAYAAAMTRTMARRLEAVSIPCRILDEAVVIRDGMPDGTVALLPYNPYPPAELTARLAVFVRRGGRLVVFYASDERLADLMGVRVGRYQRAETAGRWSAIRFQADAIPGVPGRVSQESGNIRAVQPVKGRGRVVGEWEDATGKATGDPAWVRTDAGFWMTHVLLEDGDSLAKQQMMLALLGHLDPVLFPAATRGVFDRVSGVGQYDRFESAVAAIKTRARQMARPGEVMRLLGAAETIRQTQQAHLAAGRYPEFLMGLPDYRHSMKSAYAMTEPPRDDMIRGVWDHPATGLFPGDWARTATELSRQGIRDVFVNVLWPWQAHYKQEQVPESETVRRYGDQLKAALSACREQGVRVHAWKVCWTVEGADPAWRQRLEREGRLQRSDTGQLLPWLCPSHPANRSHEKDAIRDLVRRYPVDGVHLDYIRYRDSRHCYCDGCRSRYEAARGVRIVRWPADVRKGAARVDYDRWRCEQITRLVRDVRAICRAANPAIRVSAAVYGKYPQCVDSVAQDWAAWLRTGLVDFVCPMNYTADPAVFEQYVRDQLKLAGAADRIMPGIGVTAKESRLDAIQVIDQVASLRRLGARGFVLFDLNRVLSDEVLPYLRMGATADP